MFQSPTILRRYTPPTCTLEITAKYSALSRWARETVLKDLRFQLRLDDPKLDKDEWIELQGNREQLDALSHAVSSYVQHNLVAAGDLLPPTTLSDYSRGTTVAIAEPQLESAVQTHPSGIRLQANGLLCHNLHLGTLATGTASAVVPLSTLQLFDLANALDEYETDVVALPKLQPNRWLHSPPNWTQIAAVALITVGVSASAVKLFERSPQGIEVASPTTSQGASSSDQKIAIQLPPSAIERTVPPISSDQKLPPPPLGSTVPPATSTLPQLKISEATPPSATSVPVVPPPPRQQSAPSKPNQPSAPNAIALAPEAGIAVESAKRGTAAPETMAAPPSLEAQIPAPAARTANRSAAEAQTDSNQATSDSTAFDTMPQIAEARRYFQERWSPPDGLEQTLEYSLIVGPNGSIQRIVPLGQAAGDYVDRTAIPLVGETFVSPLPEGRKQIQIRLVLRPDGSVQTFME